jgi:hypothetical protein
MLSILKFSGKRWIRSAALWLLLLLTVDGLAQVEAQDSNETLANHKALATQQSPEARARANLIGSHQVAKTTVTVLDISALSAQAFGDTDEPLVTR